VVSMDWDRPGVVMTIVEVCSLLVYCKCLIVGCGAIERATRDLCVPGLPTLQNEPVVAAHVLSLSEIRMFCVVMTFCVIGTSSENVSLSDLARGPRHGLYEMQGREGSAQ